MKTIQFASVLANFISAVLTFRVNAHRVKLDAVSEAISDDRSSDQGLYGIKDQHGRRFFVDQDGYFVTNSRTAGWFQDYAGGIRVMSGSHAGQFLYADFWWGRIKGNGKTASTQVSWSSGGPMRWHGRQVDRYKGYFYSSKFWYSKRDYKFTKHWKVPPKTEFKISESVNTVATQSGVGKSNHFMVNLQTPTIGPIFVVYLSYQGRHPSKSKAEILDMMVGGDDKTASWRGVVEASSWGQQTLKREDVYWHDVESSIDPDTWTAPGKTALRAWRDVKDMKMNVSKDPASNSFNRFMLFIPNKKTHASADVLGKNSIFMERKISWMTFAHEVGHNWGLGHAGGFIDRKTSRGEGKHFYAYADDALMGAQRNSRAPDFNAVARYRLGWIKEEQVASFPDKHIATVRALNKGPENLDGAYLVMKIECATCVPGNPKNEHNVGGTLYASFRTSDDSSLYGINAKQAVPMKQYRTYDTLTLADHVHLHFQPFKEAKKYEAPKTELWTTLGQGNTYKLPDASLWIHVCSIEIVPNGAQRAKVSASAKSRSDAVGNC